MQDVTGSSPVPPTIHRFEHRHGQLSIALGAHQVGHHRARSLVCLLLAAVSGRGASGDSQR